MVREKRLHPNLFPLVADEPRAPVLLGITERRLDGVGGLARLLRI
jgi:hypothetical protein